MDLPAWHVHHTVSLTSTPLWQSYYRKDQPACLIKHYGQSQLTIWKMCGSRIKVTRHSMSKQYPHSWHHGRACRWYNYGMRQRKVVDSSFGYKLFQTKCTGILCFTAFAYINMIWYQILLIQNCSLNISKSIHFSGFIVNDSLMCESHFGSRHK